MDIVAKTMAGLEPVLVEELKQIGATNIETAHRAVKYQGDLKVLYRSNLELRTALRILLPITRFRAKNENELYNGVKRLFWDKCISKGKTIAVNAAISSDHFNHSHYVALKTKDAIVDQLRDRWGERPDVDVENADIRINTHIHRDKVTISLDSSGQSLHKRGYRIASVDAPINEVLAAGLLLLSDWDQKTDLYDPMCGSGSFICEAALLAMNRPPQSYEKKFSFFNWKDFNPNIWLSVIEECKAREKELNITIRGFDMDRRAITASKYNIAEAGLSDVISVEVKDFFENFEIPSGSFVIINPPYDIRLRKDNIIDFFKRIGDHMKTHMKGTTVWIISSNIQALKLLGLRPSKKYSLFNGPNPAKFHKFELYEGRQKRKTNRFNHSLLLILLLGGFLNAQDSSPLPFAKKLNFVQKKFDFQVSKDIIVFPLTLGYKMNKFSLEVPKTYSFENLALFCRLEESVAQKSNVNMRFRLGSLEYVDRLESKPYTKLNYFSKK